MPAIKSCDALQVYGKTSEGRSMTNELLMKLVVGGTWNTFSSSSRVSTVIGRLTPNLVNDLLAFWVEDSRYNGSLEARSILGLDIQSMNSVAAL